MYYFLSILTGLLVTVMVVFNGELTSFYGLYISTATIHFAGLFFSSILCAIKKIPLINKNTSISLYIGGIIGVITILFNNLAFNKISVSAILALSLIGQAITSIVIDNYGLFDMPKRAFNKKKYISFLFMILGAVTMLSGSNLLMIIPITLSFLTGVTVVTSRSFNSLLAQKTTVLTSTWYYYFIGFIVSLIILLSSYNKINVASLSFSPNISIYLGGGIGVLTVLLSNITATKISSYYLTILQFIGQVFSGIALDAMLTGKFSIYNLIGGILVTIGLSLDLWIDKRNV